MNILMMTNTFTPHVGGVARSVAAFTSEYRGRGHRVLVVAPEFEHAPEDEVDVIRVPAIQHFNGSDFSVILPIPGPLNAAIEDFEPDVVHSHHPFLMGGAALRIAHRFELPLVFTHHTMYEQYTHYVPGDSDALKRFAIRLSTSYANICDRVFAPSESVADVLNQRGVKTLIDVVPTGVDLERFARGSGTGFRAAAGIPRNAFVLGHLGRLAPEKNLSFLARGIADFMRGEERAHCLVVGTGPSERDIRDRFERHGLGERLHMLGILDHPLLASAYHAMDVFAFASKSETQGMVLAEAMAAGVPVVALDAPGAREVVQDKRNGRLLMTESTKTFSSALRWCAELPAAEMRTIKRCAKKTAKAFSMERCADKALACYAKLHALERAKRHDDFDAWNGTVRLIKAEWDLITGLAGGRES